MSYTELYQVLLDGDIVFYSEYHNSWRGAFFVWNCMSKKYLGRDAGFEELQQVWDLHENEKIPLELRIVLASTFDNVMVKRRNIPFLINSIHVFSTFFGSDNNVARQIPNLENLYLDDDTFAVCWNQTSTCFSPWIIRTPEGNRKYNVFRDEKHWFLFEEDAFTRNRN